MGLECVDTPRLNAKGFGSVVRNLEDHLRDIVAAYHPWAIIVTVDLKDVIDNGLFVTCTDLRSDLRRRSQLWLENHAQHPKFRPMPNSIEIVVQIPKFESWLIAHAEALHEASLIRLKDGELIPENIDAAISDPAKWLKERMPEFKYKDPKIAKLCLSACDSEVIQRRSPSFSKFQRTLRISYQSWLSVCSVSDGVVIMSDSEQ